MENLCKRQKIKFVHGAPRNPSTQGQIERNNSTMKVNIPNIVKEKGIEPNEWRHVMHEAAYKKIYYCIGQYRKTKTKECHDVKTNDQLPQECNEK